MQLASYDHPWAAAFEQERPRLLAALGAVTEGGILEQIQHIGATSVPGLSARPCVDIGLAAWPFPLEPASLAALQDLGYTLLPETQEAPWQRFSHTSGGFQLWITEPGSTTWMGLVLLRDYLRQDEAGRTRYAARRQELASPGTSLEAYQTGKTRLLEEMQAPARGWWIDFYGFQPLDLAKQELEGFSCPWYISGGWAMDLFFGRVTRVHHDIDVVIARDDQLALQKHLTERGWRLLAPFEKRLVPWPMHMRLEPPRHQVHAHRQGAFLDFLLTDIGAGVWRYRREPTILRSEARMALRSEEGLAYLAPELILLFKSTRGKARSKDVDDFENVLPLLEPERRAWLRWALTATDPEHPWIERLGD